LLSGDEMKIAFFNIEPWEREVLKKQFSSDTLLFFPEGITSSFMKQCKDVDVLSAFVHTPLTAEVLKGFSSLKMIASRGTGYDHIDLEYCQSKGIVVCNVPTYGENTVAEHAFALMLGLSHRIVESVERTRGGSFLYLGLRGFDLKGKTLGVVGGGNIGQHVVRIAKGFEMNVLVYDVKRDGVLARKLGFKYVSLEKLLMLSDIVTLHVPYNKYTHHLLNKKTIGLMKKGAYLINTSRGAVVETDALVRALKSKRLAGAGLDVLEEEDELNRDLKLANKKNVSVEELKILLEDHALLEMSNVLITPHNAFNTQEALGRILDVTIANIVGFKRGKVKNEVGVK
jgi:D-lactate dehydrogenase